MAFGNKILQQKYYPNAYSVTDIVLLYLNNLYISVLVYEARVGIRIRIYVRVQVQVRMQMRDSVIF